MSISLAFLAGPRSLAAGAPGAVSSTLRRSDAAAAPTTAPAPRRARDAAVDVARAWSLVVVVALHSMMVGVSAPGGVPVLENALDAWTGFPAASWFVQVMPLFFVLGGFSSLTQWTRLHADGVPASRYIAMRVRRLLIPGGVAIAATAAVLWGLVLVGVPADLVAEAGFRISQPLWFLGVYILCAALVPLAAAAHRRRPVASVVVLAAIVIGVDALRGATGIELLGFLNLLFVWVLIQQIGFWLADGRLRGPWLYTAGAAGGILLAVLIAAGVYPADLYAALNPPTVALVLLGVMQAAIFVALRPALRRLHRVPGIGRAVDGVNARSMTIYSWHMLVLVGLAGSMLAIGATLPVPLSADWWSGRPLWLALVALVLIPVVMCAGRLEKTKRSARDAAPRPQTIRAAVAVVFGAGGVLAILITATTPLGWTFGAASLAIALLATGDGRHGTIGGQPADAGAHGAALAHGEAALVPGSAR